MEANRWEAVQDVMAQGAQYLTERLKCESVAHCFEIVAMTVYFLAKGELVYETVYRSEGFLARRHHCIR